MPKNDTEKDNTNTGINKPPKPEKPTPGFPLFLLRMGNGPRKIPGR